MILAKSAVVRQRIIAVALCLVFVAVQQQVTYGQQEPAPGSPEQGSQPEAPAPQGAEQMQALVAPIALYPDALVAQVLSGATFPDQIALAQNWLSEHQNLSGAKLVKEVDKQTWDPSVKALTPFPSVLGNMAKNLAWTSEVGQVYHYQPKDVMDAVQTLRAKAEEAGNFKSNEQIKVVEQSPNTIVIEPANPQVVYVPEYNPCRSGRGLRRERANSFGRFILSEVLADLNFWEAVPSVERSTRAGAAARLPRPMWPLQP